MKFSKVKAIILTSAMVLTLAAPAEAADLETAAQTESQAESQESQETTTAAEEAEKMAAPTPEADAASEETVGETVTDAVDQESIEVLPEENAEGEASKEDTAEKIETEEDDETELAGAGTAKKGIRNNGLDGININVNADPYTTFAKGSWGGYAYTAEGCAWFASARVKELTGKGSTIFDGVSWYYSQYANYGFTRGSKPKAKALVCYQNHVAVVEKVDGDTLTISEGGMAWEYGGTYGGSDYGYTIIHRIPRSVVESSSRGTGAFIGYVYLGVGNSTSVAETSEELKAFIERMYTGFLGRKSDTNGMANWVAALTSGKLSGSDMVVSFAHSNEFTSNKNITDTDYIQKCYQAILGRYADAAGLKTWKSYIDNGCSRDIVLAGLLSSAEMKEQCEELGIKSGSYTSPNVEDKNPSVTAFVSRLYTTCLNRAFDRKGLRTWVGLLLDGSWSAAQVSDGFYLSTEFLNRNLSDKTFVQNAYRTILDREPDSHGYATWTGVLANGSFTRHDVLKGFYHSTEFTKLCKSYGITNA